MKTTHVLLHLLTLARGALVVGLLMQPACTIEAVVHGRVAAMGVNAQALESGELLSVNGTYGPGCAERYEPWSIEVVADSALDHPTLSVVQNNLACVLTLTALWTSDGLATAQTAIVLTTGYELPPSAFSTPVAFYANARLSADDFADDFVLTILHSSDTASASRTILAQPTPPTVTATMPLNGAIDAGIGTNVTASFDLDNPMNAGSITDLTFTLMQGSIPIDGVVTFDDATNIATFNPDEPLVRNRDYVARITTGAEDIGGTALAADYVWSFKPGQAPMDFGTAGTFVVLASAAVTNSGPSVITGDLGSDTAVTGFPPGMLIGTQYIGAPTASDAIADLTLAYNEAASRMVDPIAVTGNLGGQTLTPALYRSISSLAVSAGDLTLDAEGNSSAVFLFQMGTTFTMTASRQILLINGASAANVFWQVGSSATLGTNSVFQGTLMADQSVTLTTGATVSGRVFARAAAITCDTNTIAEPP